MFLLKKTYCVWKTGTMKTYQIWVSGFQVPTRMPAMGSMSCPSLQQSAQPLWTALVPCLPFRGCSGSAKRNKLRNAPNNRFLNLTHKELPFSFVFLPQSILVNELGSKNIMNWFYFIRNTSLYIHLFLSPLNHVAYFGYFSFELKLKCFPSFKWVSAITGEAPKASW